MSKIKAYRADGWPLCPNCGEDELWSKLRWNGDTERPPLAAWITAGLSCYRCGWSNEKPVITPIGKKEGKEAMSNIVTIYDGPDVCPQCLGWKRVADSADGESWKYWAELPPPSNLAVVAGVIKPIVCPRCHGTGQRMERYTVELDLDKLARRIDAIVEDAIVDREAIERLAGIARLLLHELKARMSE